LDLTRSHSGGIKQIEKTLKPFFNNRLKNLKLAASSQGGLMFPLITPFKNGFHISRGVPLYPHDVVHATVNKTVNKIIIQSMADQFHIREGQPISVYHTVSGFLIGVLGEGFEKTVDYISGKVSVQNKAKDEVHKISFTVDESDDKLLAIRDGNDVALMVLRFESDDDAGGFGEEKERKPVYHTHFNNVMGCTIHSTRDSWAGGEMGKSVIDYGEAKAEIPGKHGKWKLIGHIVSDNKKRRLIGRAAVLANPKGDEVARGGQIYVPVDKPEEYEVQE
jgi:hypothetical protein